MTNTQTHSQKRPLPRVGAIVPDWVTIRQEEGIPCVSIVLIWGILQEMMAGFATWSIPSVDESLPFTSAEAFELRQHLYLAAVLDTISSSAVLAES